MKRFLLLAILVVTGAIANVIVAWCCSRWSDHWPKTSSVESTAVREVPPAMVDYLDDPKYFQTAPARPTGLSFCESRSTFCTRGTYTRWVGQRYILGFSRSHELVQFGFPFRSMQYEMRSWHDSASYPEVGIWRIPDPRGGWPPAPEVAKQQTVNEYKGSYTPPDHVYPTTLIPLGFVANTLIYTFVILALARVPGALRRYLRRRDSLCSRCAYPLGPTPLCPECGLKTPTTRS